MVFLTAFLHFFTPLFIMSELSDLTIQVTPREQTGRQACKKLRSAGRIPAVLYGKEFNQSYSLDDREMRTLLRKASGTTSLPMPSPGITAISYLFFAIFMILWSAVCLCAGQ